MHLLRLLTTPSHFLRTYVYYDAPMSSDAV